MHFKDLKAREKKTQPRTEWGRNRLIWSPNESSFPMTQIQRGSFLTGVFCSALGVFFTALPVISLVGGTLRSGFHWGPTLMMTPFILAGLLILLYGVSQFFYRKIITLRKEEVEVDEISFFGRKHWKEKIRKFEGVLKEPHYYAGGTSGAGRTYYEIILKHSEHKRDIPLFLAPSWRYVEERWKHFSQHLNVYALERTDQGITRQSPRVLEQNLRESMKGRDVLWIEPEKLELSQRVSVIREGSAYRISYPMRWGALPGMIATLCGVLGITASFLWVPASVSQVTLVLSSFFTLQATLSTVGRFICHEELLISYCGVERRFRYPWGARLLCQYPAELIHSVLLRRGPWFYLPKALIFDAGSDALEFGRFLPLKDKEHLHQLFIVILSHGPAPLQIAS